MTEPQPTPAPSAAFSIGEAVGYGWKGFWANIGPLALVFVIVLVINLLFNLVGAAVDSGIGRLVIAILNYVVSLLIGLAWIRAGLAVTAGRRPEMSELFQVDERFGTYLVATILYTIMMVIGFVLLIIPGIIVVLVFGLYGWTIADRGLGVVESLSRSAEITRGHRLELFGLGVVLILINIVGLLCLIVGVVFTMGISLVTLAYTYRVLSGEPVAPQGGGAAQAV